MVKKSKKWFQEAVAKKPPYELGWRKDMSLEARRRAAVASRPKNWTPHHRLLSTAQALQSLHNVTKDRETKRLAAIDARYFYAKAKKAKK